MDANVEGIAKSYDEKDAIARKFIAQGWGKFEQQTKDWLIASKHYDEYGNAQLLANAERSSEIDSLETSLGVFKCCAEVILPARWKSGAVIAADALSDEVINAAREMMYSRYRHEREFLILAFMAVRNHQIANLLAFRLPLLKENWFSGFKLFLTLALAILNLILLLASPAFLGYAIASASKGDVGGAVSACYGLGFAVFIFCLCKNIAKETPLTGDEIAYNGWMSLDRYSPWPVVGAGTAAYLKDMMRKGAMVPIVALDLCALLTARIVR